MPLLLFVAKCTNHFLFNIDRDQCALSPLDVSWPDRRAEAKLAKYGSEPSTGADLLMR